MSALPESRGPWALPVAVWRLLFLLCLVGSLLVLFVLQPGNAAFDERIIGIATIANSDVYHRLFTYILALVGFIALACVFFLGRLAASTRESFPVVIDIDWLLAACAALNGLAWAASDDMLFLWTALLSLALYLAWQLRVFMGGTSCREREFLLAAGLAWQGTTILFMLAAWAQGWAFALVFLLALPLSLVMGRCIGPGGSRPGISRVYAGLLMWVVSAPLLYVGVIEIRAIGWTGEAAPSPYRVFALLSLVAVFLGASLRDRGSLLAWCAALGVLLSTIVLNEYKAGINYTFYDTFHLGEKMLPLQQWRDFGALPFVDYMPTHGLADTMPQALYTWLSGGSDLEAMIWGNGHFKGWVMRGLSMSLLFLFLGRVISLVPAFLLVWLLPTYHVFEPYFTLLLLPALHILVLDRYKRPALWWTVQWVLAGLLYLWRLDFGVAVSVSNLAIAVAMSQRTGRLTDLLSPLVIATGLVITALVASYLAAGQALFEYLSVLRAYMGAQIPGTSYAEFYETLNYPFIVQYILLPVLTSLVFAYSLSALLRGGIDGWSFRLHVLQVFLGALALILSVRSLQRHTLLEGDFNSYLHLLVVLLFAVRYFALAARTYSGVFLAIILMGSYWLLPKAESFMMRAMYHPSIAKEYVFAAPGGKLPSWHDKRRRYRDSVNTYDDFLAFMDSGLSQNQTFYDFANAPLLYALTGVELPTYIPQTGYQISESLQARTLNSLANLYRKKRLPYVLFAQGIRGWDELDGAHNVLRSYRIAEFIYHHYRPCLHVSHFDIWLDRRWTDADSGHGSCVAAVASRRELPQDLVARLRPLEMHSPQQFVAFGYLPLVWATEDEIAESVLSTVSLQVVSGEQRIALSAPSGQAACGERPCYLDLQVDSDINGEVVVNFGGRDQFSFAIEAGSFDYRIRLSVLWDWFRLQELPVINLHAGTGVSVASAELVVVE